MCVLHCLHLCVPHVQGVAEAECRRAAAAAEEVYIREFNQEGTPAEPDALLQEHLVSSTGTLLPFLADTLSKGYLHKPQASLLAMAQHGASKYVLASVHSERPSNDQARDDEHSRGIYACACTNGPSCGRRWMFHWPNSAEYLLSIIVRATRAIPEYHRTCCSCAALCGCGQGGVQGHCCVRAACAGCRQGRPA